MIRNEYAPSSVSTPGSTLGETLDALGMTQAELAQRTGRPVKTINEIVRGKAAITPETALQLERALGIPAGFWQARESQYREFLIRKRESQRLKRHVDALPRNTIRAMQKLGWIPPAKEPVELLRSVLDFFGCATVETLRERQHQVQFRASAAFVSDPIAVGAWLRKGHLDAHQIHCAAFDAERFAEALEDIRKLSHDLPPNFALRLQELCASAGVAVVFVPELPGTRLWGAARWLSATKAIIQLSLRYKTDDHLWFTFFHEAGHLLKHGRREVFIESNDSPDDVREREADRFAAEMLIPAAEVRRGFPTRFVRKEDVLAFAERLKVAPGIVVGRLQHEGILPPTHLNALKQTIALSEQDRKDQH
jgi:addiction module HigA family antidote